MATGGINVSSLLSIENMAVVAVKYIQLGNTLNFSNHQQKFSHLHFYEVTFITEQNYNMEYAPFSFAFYGTKYASILLSVILISRLKLKRHLGGTDGS